jgi:hypothetical protein
LLKWRKWRAPNNASKQQMGFNSALKGLNLCTFKGKSTASGFQCGKWRLAIPLSAAAIVI